MPHTGGPDCHRISPVKSGDLNAENGYQDNLLDTVEDFGLWGIEGPERLAEELPFANAGLPVLVTKDHNPYKQRNVRILNGAHTTVRTICYAAVPSFTQHLRESSVMVI